MDEMMTTIQQLTFIGPNRFEWRETRAPKIATDVEAIVRPLAVSRCDLDLYMANGAYPIEGPFAFGHEIAGEVIDLGDQVASVHVGDRVIVPFQISCGQCAMCRRGFTNACLSVPNYAAYGLAPSSGKEWGGGFSDLIHVPFADAMLVKIPETMSLSVAATLSDNVIDAYRVVVTGLKMHPGASVLICGGLGQSTGLFAVQFAIALGAERVVYLDFDGARCAKARRLGAAVIKCAYGQYTPNEEFPVVIDACAQKAGLQCALISTAPCGICLSISNPVDGKPEWPLRSMYMKGATYSVGRVHARGSLTGALNCVTCGGVDPRHVISDELSFSDAAEALPDQAIKPVFLR